MLLYKSSLLFFLIILFNCGWATSSVSDDGTQNNPKIKYKELFPASSHLSSSSGSEIFHVVDGAIKAFERPYYYWLLSSLQKLEIVARDDPTVSGNTLLILTGVTSRLDAVRYADEVALFAEVDTKIKKYANLHKPQESEMPKEQYSDALDAWTGKYSDKRHRYKDLDNLLRTKRVSGKQLKVLLYELAFFLNLISFETAFEVLQKHRQEEGYTKVLANTLGDSLLDGGKQLGQFYEQLETALGTIGYSPKDLKMLEGAASSEVAGVLRDILGELIFVKNYGPEQRKFVKRMWRAACTLHLVATLRHVSTSEPSSWEEIYAPMLYQAIDVGSTEVFDAGYKVYKGHEYIEGHNMLVEVQKASDSSYHVRQFNSGDGLRNHVTWRVSTSGSEERRLSFVDMPALSEDQIKQSGYYYAISSTSEAAIEKLYKNKHLAQPPPTDPLLYERPQQAGTCAASSKMFYLRSLGFHGRMLEIDFKVELIKQLLDRIDRVHAKGALSRPALLHLIRAEERARLAKNTGEEAEIGKGFGGVLKALKMEVTDQCILLFPDMFISLIASTLNDILYSFYWIIENGRSDMARTLFEHFLKETKPIFKETSSYGSQLLDGVSPLIRDLHTKLLAGATLPFELGSVYEPGKRSVATQEAVTLKVKEIRENCVPSLSESSGQETDYSMAEFSKEKLPACFYHVIDAVYTFPYAPELATITSWLAKKLKFKEVPLELSYILIDAMRVVYGEDFYMDDKVMRQVAFASNLDWGYRAPEGSTDEDCEAAKLSHRDMLTNQFNSVARCIYLSNDSDHSPFPLLKRILMIKQTCNQLTAERLPTCFYHIIKTIRDYPDAPELQSVTRELYLTPTIPDNFRFENTPPALAYLLHDAMQLAYDEFSFDSMKRWSQIWFYLSMPRTYQGDKALLKNCGKATDESILKNWKWVAACRFDKNGPVGIEFT